MIVLSIAGSPSLTLERMPGGNDDFVSRSSVEAISVTDLSATGIDTIAGSGTQYFIWSFNSVVTWDEMMLFETIKKRQQFLYKNMLNGAITLSDYHNYVPHSEMSENRTIISTTTTSWGGLAAHISCSVMLRIPENHTKRIAGDWYLLQFDAKEIN